jgi:hypothetical protein
VRHVVFVLLTLPSASAGLAQARRAEPAQYIVLISGLWVAESLPVDISRNAWIPSSSRPFLHPSCPSLRDSLSAVLCGRLSLLVHRASPTTSPSPPLPHSGRFSSVRTLSSFY